MMVTGTINTQNIDGWDTEHTTFDSLVFQATNPKIISCMKGSNSRLRKPTSLVKHLGWLGKLIEYGKRVKSDIA